MSEADPYDVAKTWASVALYDLEVASRMRANFRALVLQSMEPGGLNTVTSATKNAMQMGKEMSLDIPRTLLAFRECVRILDLGYVPCRSRSIARF